MWYEYTGYRGILPPFFRNIFYLLQGNDSENFPIIHNRKSTIPVFQKVFIYCSVYSYIWGNVYDVFYHYIFDLNAPKYFLQACLLIACLCSSMEKPSDEH